jgi:ribosomal protein L29
MKEIKDLKMKDTPALQKLDVKKLYEEEKQASKTLFVLRMKQSVGELKQTHLITALRKYIASVNTFINTTK